MTLVAGIDSSTQSCKVVVVELESGALVRTGRAPHPPGTEVEPAAWWDALQTALIEAGGLEGVAAISVAAQQHGMVALDASGRVVRPALLWNDTRSAAAARALVAEFGAAALARRTGSVPVASFTSAKLRWLRDAEPDTAARVAAVALPHDWLTWRLRGFGPEDPALDELTTDRSDASGTGYWDPRSGDYDREILVAALGHDVLLPRVLGPAESPDGPGIVIGPGAGDNAAAALGLGAAGGDAVVSLGTSGTVYGVAPRPSADPTGIVSGFADAAGAFLPLVATLNAARVLDIAARILGVDHDELGRLALAAPPGSGGLVLRPYFAGERTPDLPDATADLRGMSLESTTRENLARAFVEGMLCGLADGLDAVRSAGVRVDRIVLTGGGARNAAVPLIAAQVFGVPVDVPEPAEDVALGAAHQATWALTGVRPTWDARPTRRAEAALEPVIRERYAAG